MDISADEVRHIASLARLALSDDEVARFQIELSKILTFVAQLEDVDVPDLPEVPDPRNPLRADEVEPVEDVERLHQEAPQFVDGYYRVPKVIE